MSERPERDYAAEMRIRRTLEFSAAEPMCAAMDTLLSVLEGRAPFIALSPAFKGEHVDVIEARRQRILTLRDQLRLERQRLDLPDSGARTYLAQDGTVLVRFEDLPDACPKCVAGWPIGALPRYEPTVVNCQRVGDRIAWRCGCGFVFHTLTADAHTLPTPEQP